jgi:hypothetical protein
LKARGFCLESDWAFGMDRVRKLPDWKADRGAYDQRIVTGFYRISSSGPQFLTDIRRALSQQYPVIYGGPVTETYERYTGGIMKRLTDAPLGAHMRCLVGYESNCFYEANSWGIGWGETGCSRLSEDFVTWDQNFDFWVFNGVPQPSSLPAG